MRGKLHESFTLPSVSRDRQIRGEEVPRLQWQGLGNSSGGPTDAMAPSGS